MAKVIPIKKKKVKFDNQEFKHGKYVLLEQKEGKLYISKGFESRGDALKSIEDKKPNKECPIFMCRLSSISHVR